MINFMTIKPVFHLSDETGVVLNVQIPQQVHASRFGHDFYRFPVFPRVMNLQ